MIKSRRLRYIGHVARMGEARSALKISTGKRSLGNRRHRWEYNISLDLKKIGINI